MVVEVTQQRIFCSWPFYCQAAAAAACQQRVPDCVRKWTPAITVLVHAHRLADVSVQKGDDELFRPGEHVSVGGGKKRNACRSVRWTGLLDVSLFQLRAPQSSESEAVVVAC